MADAFTAAARSRSLQLWTPRLTSADVELSGQRELAAGRARDLGVNSAYGANAMRIHRDNVVGPRFTFACKPNARLLGIDPKAGAEWAREVESLWEAYANAPTFDVDAARMLNFPALLQMAYLGIIQSGEALGVLKWKPGPEGFGTCILMIEPERLSNPPDKATTVNCRHGIEVDKDGAPLAYWIKDVHESDVQATWGDPSRAFSWKRVQRQTSWGRPVVLHLFDRYRPDMRRGISAFSAALVQAKLVDEYDVAEVESALLKTMFAAVIKTNLTTKDAAGVLGATTGIGHSQSATAAQAIKYMGEIAPYVKEMQLHVGGAKAVHLLPNEELQLLQAEAAGKEYEAFQSAMIRKLAAATGVTAEQLSRDFSKMTFASAKMSLGEIWRHFIMRRELLIRQFAIPLVGAWLEEAIDAGRLTLPNGKKGNANDFVAIRSAVLNRSTFISWGPPQVDPLKEAQAKKENLILGLTTLQQEAQDQGQDWEEIIEQRARENEAMTALDLPLAHELDQKPALPGAEGGPPERDSAGNPAR